MKTWYINNSGTFWFDPEGEFDINSDSCYHTAAINPTIQSICGDETTLEAAINAAKEAGIIFDLETQV